MLIFNNSLLTAGLCPNSFSMSMVKMLQSQDATWHMMWQNSMKRTRYDARQVKKLR